MASEIERIFRFFHRNTYPSGVLEFEYLLTNSVRDVLEKSQQDADAYVISNRNRYWNRLLEQVDYDKKSGRTPLFLIKDPTSWKVFWLPNNLSTLSSRREKHKALRLRAKPDILRMIDRLSDRQYEALGCVVCKLAGSKKTKLTPRGNEGGIDFFSTVNNPSRCHVFNGAYRPLRIVGQSKKYTSKVQVDRVKEFTKTLQEVRNQNPSVESLVPPWFRAATGPIVGWLIAHNGLQSGAATKAKHEGIIVSDSLDLAEIAALSRDIDYTLPANQRVQELHSFIDELLVSEGISD